MKVLYFLIPTVIVNHNVNVSKLTEGGKTRIRHRLLIYCCKYLKMQSA